MSLTTSEMTPADIRACTCNNDGNNGGMWGGDWLAYLLLFALIGGGGFGFGGFGGGGVLPWLLFGNGGFGGAGATNGYVLTSDFANIERKLDGINNGICDATFQLTNNLNSNFRTLDGAICNLGYQALQNTNAIQTQLAQCCCDNRAAIADVKYTIANEGCDTRHAIYNSSRDIIDNANANSRAILDFLTQDKLATLTAENQALKFQASQTAQNAFITANQEAQTAELIRRLGADCPTPAYVVQPPTPVNFPTNCCGQVQFANPCNTGCGSY